MGGMLPWWSHLSRRGRTPGTNRDAETQVLESPLEQRASAVRSLLWVILPAAGVWLSACSDEPFTSCNPAQEACGAGTGGRSNGGTSGASTGGASSGASGSGAMNTPQSGAGGEAGASGEAGAGGNGQACDLAASPAAQSCLVINTYGVFVSPVGSDTDGDGSRESPFATLAKALGQAKAQKKRVFACATEGAFEESVMLDLTLDKSTLYGGFDCGDWSYAPDRATEVRGSGRVALRAIGLKALTIEDFAFTAADAAEPGESSVGAWIQESTGVVLRRVVLHAGKGADGADGASASASSAAGGQPGSPGTAACTVETDLNPGGPAVESLCGGVASVSVSGRGGMGASQDGNAGDGGAGLPTMGASGAAGSGQTALSTTWDCGVGAGHAGALGVSHPTASGGSGEGVLSATGFESPAGADGANGKPGQGGGGGGGALAPTSCGGAPITGASGGSGGAGGCGGHGGAGGKGGGASFALASIDSEVVLEATTLTSSLGGSGGNGGSGQPGGKGGIGGEGATGVASDSCGGGAGGRGGNGAAGGGGAGGPSAGIAFVGAAPERVGNIEFELAEIGALGGLDGKGLGAGAGAIGATAESLEY